uniref:Uncharacterized protein n=1 Tax=Zea mays TaxID=4577 RepID=B8A2Y1_MAIZE|nr:unknown [Zea mays]ACR36709.1 unknown [Zea mays]ACR36874.1 unknown [Zea mays]
MCTMPVARMTPAANALTAKKTSPSGRSAEAERPSSGTSTPAAPDARMDATATSFSRSAPRASSSLIAAASPPPQSHPTPAAAAAPTPGVT